MVSCQACILGFLAGRSKRGWWGFVLWGDLEFEEVLSPEVDARKLLVIERIIVSKHPSDLIILRVFSEEI